MVISRYSAPSIYSEKRQEAESVQKVIAEQRVKQQEYLQLGVSTPNGRTDFH